MSQYGGIKSANFGPMIGSNRNPSFTDRGVSYVVLDSKDYDLLSDSQKSSLSEKIYSYGASPVVEFTSCPNHFTIPAGAVNSGDVRIGYVTADDGKFTSADWVLAEHDYSFLENFSGRKIRILDYGSDTVIVCSDEESGSWQIHVANLNEETTMSFVDPGSYGGGTSPPLFYSNLISGPDNDLVAYSFSDFSDIWRVSLPSRCSAITYHALPNPGGGSVTVAYAAFPDEGFVRRYYNGTFLNDTSSPPRLDLYYECTSIVSCGDYVALIDKLDGATPAGGFRIVRGINDNDANTDVVSYDVPDANYVVYNSDDNTVHFIYDSFSVIEGYSLDGLDDATPSLGSPIYTVSLSGDVVTDVLLSGGNVWLVIDGVGATPTSRIEKRSTVDGSLVETQILNGYQNVTSVSIDPDTENLWTIGPSLDATPTSNIFYYSGAPIAPGLKGCLVTIDHAATPTITSFPIDYQDFITNTLSDGAIPLISIIISSFNNLDQDAPFIDEIVGNLNYDSPIFLTIASNPDTSSSANAETWLSYQRYVRSILYADQSLNSRICFVCGLTDSNVQNFINNPSLSNAFLGDENIWDMLALTNQVEIDESQYVDFTSELLLSLGEPQFQWMMDNNFYHLLNAFIISSNDENGPVGVDFINTMYSFALQSGDSTFWTEAGYSDGIQVHSLILVDIASPLTEGNLLLSSFKEKFSEETSVDRYSGNQTKVLYDSSKLSGANGFIVYAKDYMLNSFSNIFVFGNDQTFQLTDSSDDATPSVMQNYIDIFSGISSELSGSPVILFGPNFDLSPRGGGYDQTYNGVLMDSRYVSHLESFIDAISSATPIDATGVAFMGDFGEDQWPDVIDYIKNNLGYSSSLMITDFDSGLPVDTYSQYRLKFNNVSDSTDSYRDYIFVSDSFVFLGDYTQTVFEWLFDGNISVYDEMNDAVLNFDAYSENILTNGYIEISSDSATPYSFSGDIPSSGNSLVLGDLPPGNYSVRIFGSVGDDGYASMSLSLDSSNFDKVSLSVSDYFTAVLT